MTAELRNNRYDDLNPLNGGKKGRASNGLCLFAGPEQPPHLNRDSARRRGSSRRADIATLLNGKVIFVKHVPVRRLMLLSAVVLMGVMAMNVFSAKDWRTASSESARIAPDPQPRTRRFFTSTAPMPGVGGAGLPIHTWIAAKRTGETAYTVYDVVGWRGYHGQPVLRIARDVPDRYWYGEKPRILKAHKGAGVDELIAAVNQAADAYPWKRCAGPLQARTQHLHCLGRQTGAEIGAGPTSFRRRVVEFWNHASERPGGGGGGGGGGEFSSIS